MRIDKIIITVALVIFYAVFSVAGCQEDEYKIYNIGDRGPAGGLVFYDKGIVSNGWRYLEAAPEDICASSRWDNGKKIDRETGKYIITGATDTDVGTGKLNTEKIIKTYGEGKYAAKQCAEYRGGGKDDWFLPSRDELDLMYKNLHKQKKGNFTDFYYWSSSEKRLIEVYVKQFGYSDDFDILGKGFSPFAVRPVRAF